MTSFCDAVNGTLHVVTPRCPESNATAASFVSPFRGGLPLHCRVDALNLHLVAVFHFGTGSVHKNMVPNHVDPFMSEADNDALLEPQHRIRQVAELLQASRLEPDAVVVTSVFWDMLQRYMDYAQSVSQHGAAVPPFSTGWALDHFLPRAQTTLLDAVRRHFPSASFKAWRTSPPVNEHVVGGVY